MGNTLGFSPGLSGTSLALSLMSGLHLPLPTGALLMCSLARGVGASPACILVGAGEIQQTTASAIQGPSRQLSPGCQKSDFTLECRAQTSPWSAAFGPTVHRTGPPARGPWCQVHGYQGGGTWPQAERQGQTVQGT